MNTTIDAVKVKDLPETEWYLLSVAGIPCYYHLKAGETLYLKVYPGVAVFEDKGRTEL